jgi:DNA-binding GntR family transcriptional regulator
MAKWNLDTNYNMKTREELVADQIREAILRGYFKPGEKLDQQEIAEQLNVSRSPVREALRTLAAEELITLSPYRGAVVTELSREELAELHFLRTLLEGAAARRAVPHLRPEHLARMKTILEEADRTSDYEKILILNNEFHRIIYSAKPQPRLLSMIQNLRNIMAPYIRLYLDVPGRQAIAWADHRRIYDACSKRDAELAERETQKHLQQVFEGIMLSILDQPT